MAAITVYGDGSYSSPSGDFGSYYIDEPFERLPSLTTSNTISIAYQINSVNSDAKIELISYKKPVDGYTMMYSIVLGGTSNSEMMCDQYYDQSIWCGDDQRTHWTLFKNYYTSARVKSHFIHLLIDEQQGDFNMLFGHANNLGINELWIYAGDAGDDGFGDGEILTEPYYDLYLYELGSAAWDNGWLRAIQRKYIYEYRCSYYDPCDCDPDLPDGWYLNRIYPMNEYREILNDGTIIPYTP